MFNKQAKENKKVIDKLLKKLGLERTYYWDGDYTLKDHPSVISRLETLERRILVENYFIDCPCCNGSKKILRSDSISFKKPFYKYGSKKVVTYHTTKEQYEAHKPKIKEWEKEIEKYKKENK
jgi:hypothetical protein